MPRSKSGRKRPPINSGNMKKAVQAVMNTDEPMTFGEAANTFNVKKKSLQHQVKKFRDDVQVRGEDHEFVYKPNYSVKRVFTDEEETMLVHYIKLISIMKYGLSKRGVRELAYKYAQAKGKTYPEIWNENKVAGISWMRCFMERNKISLTLRKPEGISKARLCCFNKSNVTAFFENILNAYKKYGPFEPSQIWNLDETGLTTVQDPQKFVTTKEDRNPGKITAGERGLLVTLICSISPTGNQVPPFFVFPRK